MSNPTPKKKKKSYFLPSPRPALVGHQKKLSRDAIS